jgi:hypothetical protein
VTAATKAEETVYITGPKVAARYQRTDMTLHRWLNDPAMNFPRPTYFGRYRYWKIAELEKWEAEQANQPGGRFSRSSAESSNGKAA